jgi:hypothetical protein
VISAIHLCAAICTDCSFSSQAEKVLEKKTSLAVAETVEGKRSGIYEKISGK